MKLFIVALAFLLVGNNADQLGKSPSKLYGEKKSNLPATIVHEIGLDENELNLENFKDDDALNENKLSEGVPIDHKSLIIGTLISNQIKKNVNALIQSIPAVYIFRNNFISVSQIYRGFGAHWNNVELKGFNNINIDNINVNFLGTRADVVLRWPKVEVLCGNIGMGVTALNTRISASKSGSVSVTNIVLVVNLKIKPISLTITNVDVSIISPGSVQSKFSVQLLGADISRAYNDLVEKVIPILLTEDNLHGILRDQLTPYHDLNEPIAEGASVEH